MKGFVTKIVSHTFNVDVMAEFLIRICLVEPDKKSPHKHASEMLLEIKEQLDLKLFFRRLINVCHEDTKSNFSYIKISSVSTGTEYGPIRFQNDFESLSRL